MAMAEAIRMTVAERVVLKATGGSEAARRRIGAVQKLQVPHASVAWVVAEWADGVVAPPIALHTRMV
jgi:hypothetical protein